MKQNDQRVNNIQKLTFEKKRIVPVAFIIFEVDICMGSLES